ncbi:MAG TPA: hypothetical protein PK668_14760 [Myxococcota bacterium]|nr:hypothetical protein [Myxococcota bacterium]HRY93874.1 hypothetical protein [Myxococcota bacterium]HSA22030.1 hypothetical protein [Myxococcota bacterium]
MPRYDAIVVGAGHAGLACAAELGGRKVLLLEGRESVVQKARGCLGLGLPVGARLEARGDELVLPEHHLAVPGGVRGLIHRLELRGHRERAFLPLETPRVVVDERRLKGAWLRRLEASGIEVQLGNPVRELQTDGREARVRADVEHQARVVVGADGVHGPVAQHVNPRREKLGVLFQREVEVDRLEVGRGTLMLHLLEAGRWFLAMGFEDRCLASVVELLGPHGVPGDLDRLLADRIERLGGRRRLATRAAVVRLLAPAQHAYRANVLAAGDGLATFGFASLTGALAGGHLAGRAAGRFLAGSSFALPDYQQRWRQATGQGRLERLRWLAPLVGRLDPDRLDRLLRLARRERSQDLHPWAAAVPRWLTGLLLEPRA